MAPSENFGEIQHDTKIRKPLSSRSASQSPHSMRLPTGPNDPNITPVSASREDMRVLTKSHDVSRATVKKMEKAGVPQDHIDELLEIRNYLTSPIVDVEHPIIKESELADPQDSASVDSILALYRYCREDFDLMKRIADLSLDYIKKMKARIPKKNKVVGIHSKALYKAIKNHRVLGDIVFEGTPEEEVSEEES